MPYRAIFLFSVAVALFVANAAYVTAAEAVVRDAYVRGSQNGQTWTIGTERIEMTFDGRNDQFRLVRFANKACKPPVEYVDEKTAAAPFSLNIDRFGKNVADNRWRLTGGTARQVVTGGRPAVQLDLTLARESLAVQFHVLAFPGTSILRQWVELENRGGQPIAMPSPGLASFRLRGNEATAYLHSWLSGGYATVTQGKLWQKPVTASYGGKLTGTGSGEFVPWTALHRNSATKDGLFLALEYLGVWSLAVDHTAGAINLTAGIPELKGKSLGPGQRLEMPMVTFGVFCDGLDNMASSLYDWQYEYLWDYANPSYYARSRVGVHWFFCSRNLQEQFTARLGSLDMATSDAMRVMGHEMLWDDAGWSSYPGLPPDGYGSVFTQTYEGPDFAETQRYLQKMGMHWLLWFAGRPRAGLLDGKIGAWGDFEWRTDSVSFPDMNANRSFHADVKRFLDANPGSSFHTCSGGSTYAHTFEIGGRYSSYNYLSDLGRGPLLNHYFSYLEPPDRWGDIIVSIASIYCRKDGSARPMDEIMAERKGVPPSASDLRYVKEVGRAMLTAVPCPYWGTALNQGDRELARRDMDLYRYFRSEGLAGRWSYLFHPSVEGDLEYHYFQRTNRDRRKACIIITHQAEKPVVVRPRCLVPDGQYSVEFDFGRPAQQRTGADLMQSGIALKDHKPGELVYLNLSNRPGSGRDKSAPRAPGRVLMRRETNIGHSGIGIYWSPGTDNNWISYYEVRRDNQVIDKAAIGNYYFDHAAGWSDPHQYAVRTVDGDGNASDWTVAKAIAGEPVTFAAIGGHFPQSGRDGWSAESTADSRTFSPMTWVPPAKNPAADFGGTPHQRGGVEGYWEGSDGARVGRGWQQASKTQCCVRAWTAAEAGTVRVSGRAMREYYHRAQGGPLRVKILQNDKQVWPANDWAVVPVGDLNGAMHNIVLKVAKGDVVRFVLDKGTTPEHDLLAWMPRIVYEETGSQAATTTARILCGSKADYTDHCGNLWTADRHFAGGHSISTSEDIAGAMPTADDHTLYQNGRAGRDFSYAIPVSPGIYAVRLKFAEPKHAYMWERPFSIDLNGQRMLDEFDIVQAAKLPRKAVEQTFRYVVPNTDGQIVLRFAARSGASDDAMVQAIEILPEPKKAIRINAGSDTEFVDWNGQVWAADAHFEGGTMLKSALPVAQASPTLYDQQLYRTARTGKVLGYVLTVPPGLYTVHLKFAELWQTTPGKRPMDIEVNGRVIRKAWDPTGAAGAVNMAADIRTGDIAPDKDGRITIRIRATGENDAILQAIEIE